MTTTLAPEHNLAETMARLESALLSPPISGELSAWVHAVQDAAATLAMDLATFQRTVLHVQYAQIALTDPEMSAKVEKMVEGERQLHKQVSSFHEGLHYLAEATTHVKRNEGKLAERRDHIEKQGIALVVGIKKQQAAASTWLAEAFFRDRGVQD